MKQSNLLILLLILRSSNLGAEDSLIDIVAVSKVGTIDSYMRADIAKGAVEIDDFDVVIPVRSCPADYFLQCFFIGGLRVVFSLPKNYESTDRWFFAGAEFQVVERKKMSLGGEFLTIRGTSRPSTMTERECSLGLPTQTTWTIWYSTTEGLISAETVSVNCSGELEEKTWLVHSNPLLPKHLSQQIPEELLFTSDELELLHSPEITNNDLTSIVTGFSLFLKEKT
jgi:hypothetical protein